MLLKIIDGCVEINNRLNNIGDIIDCPEERAKILIEEGYCEKLDKYEIQKYKDEQKSLKDNKIKKNDNFDKVNIEKGEEEITIDDFKSKFNI